MNQSALLAAVRRRAPDSFAPDGAPLRFIPVSHVLPFNFRRGKTFQKSDTSATPFQACVAGPDAHSHGVTTVWPNHQPRNNGRDDFSDLNSFLHGEHTNG